MNYHRYFRLAPAVLSAALLHATPSLFGQSPGAALAPVPAAPAADAAPAIPPAPEIAPPAASSSPVINDSEIPGGDPAPAPKGRKANAEAAKRAEQSRRNRLETTVRIERNEPTPDVFLAQRDGFLGDVDNIRAQAERQVADMHKQLNGMRGLFSSGTNRRTMVLPSGATDPQSLAQTHEDLVVMHRLLTKALSSKSNTKEFAFRFNSDDRQVDAMYLEGYGAVFLLNVDYPLVETPKHEKPAPEVEPKDPAWDDERRSALGEDPTGGNQFGAQEWGDDSKAAAPEFNPDRVNRLQTRMIDTLKHAANIRNLKPEDDVIVVIAGRSQPRVIALAKTKPVAFGAGEPTIIGGGGGISGGAMIATAPGAPKPPYTRTVSADTGMALIASDRGSQSSLVLRVKKSAVDALAAGKLDADGFKSAVKITAQPGDAPIPAKNEAK